MHLQPVGGIVQLDSAWLDACVALDLSSLNGLWTAGQWSRELADSSRLCLGLVVAGDLVGVACGWLVVDELQISVVAVDPDRRRRGVGRQLLEALLKAAQGKGACQATLEVAPDNVAAVALYTSLGFTTTGTRNGYYSDGRDALIRWKDLVPTRPA